MHINKEKNDVMKNLNALGDIEFIFGFLCIFLLDLQNVFAHYVRVIFEKIGLFSYDLLWKFLRILGG
jgi:hypothetical protein